MKDYEDLILYETAKGFWVSNEGNARAPKYHVWIPGVTHSKVDSAYEDITVARARADYLDKTKKTR